MKKMKWIVAALAACALAIAATGCDDGFTEAALNAMQNNAEQNVPAESVTLKPRTLTLKRGTTKTLEATVLPEDTTDKVRWSSSDEKVATVDREGTVTAVAEGTAVITAKAGDFTAECTVTVREILVPVQYVRLSPTSLTLTRGETGQLTATVYPSDADITTVTWQSDDEEVATVDEDGTVTAVKAGSARITATTEEGGKTATCWVTVNPIPVDRITIKPEELSLVVGTTGTLTAEIEPEDADVTSVRWSTSSWSVANVSGDGTVWAYKKGEATITVTIKWGSGYWDYTTAERTVTVTVPDMGTDFELDDYGYLTKYAGSDTNVVIPEGVTGIRSEAFKDNTAITGVTIPDSVTSVGESAFYGCSRLTEVKYAGTLEQWCGIEWGNYSANPLSNGNAVLYVGLPGAAVTDMEIPSGVEAIKSYAFSGCASLTSVKIPDGVTSIRKYAFGGCASLASVTIPDSVESIEWGAFYGCTSLASVKIPDGVTSIEGIAFEGCTSLASVKIPDGVTSIEESTFYGCTSLASVKIPDGVTSIGVRAFEGCTSLASVTIPDSVTSIGWSAFEGCTSLASVKIPDGVTSIEESTFYGCTSLTSVTIPASVTSIGQHAFEGCSSLKEIQFTGTVAQWKAIGGSNGVTIPCIQCSDGYIGVKDVPAYLTMSRTKVTGYTDSEDFPAKLVIPDGVTEIGWCAFKECTKLKRVEIPASVTYINYSAFRDCTSLTSVTIGEGVKSIGDWAFYGCTNLATINYTGTEEQWNAITKGSYWDSDTGNYTITYNYTE